MDKLQVLQWLNKEKIGSSEIFSKYLMDRLAHIGIKMHGIYKIHFRIFFRKIFHGCYHANKAITKVFAPVPGDKYKFLALVKSRNIVASRGKNLLLLRGKNRIISEFVNDHLQSINDCITCNIDLPLGTFGYQVLL